MHAMQLSDLSVEQLERIYARLYRSLGSSGCYGWDWITLKLTRPGKAVLMKSILWEMDRKLKALPKPLPTITEVSRS